MTEAELQLEIVGRLDQATSRLADDLVGREIENIASLAMGALVMNNAGVIGSLHDQIEKIYSRIRLGENRLHFVAGQLSALTTVLAVASLRGRVVDIDTLLSRPTSLKILVELQQSDSPVNNKQLAIKIRASQEAVGKNIRQLRAAGLVTTRQLWRDRCNTLTKFGLKVLEQAHSSGMVARICGHKNITPSTSSPMDLADRFFDDAPNYGVGVDLKRETDNAVKQYEESIGLDFLNQYGPTSEPHHSV